MGAIVGRIIPLILQLLAGVGVAKVMDKTLPDKVPTYEPVGIEFKPMKILWFVVAMVAGAMVTKFIGKKLNIKLLK